MADAGKSSLSCQRDPGRGDPCSDPVSGKKRHGRGYKDDRDLPVIRHDRNADHRRISCLLRRDRLCRGSGREHPGRLAEPQDSGTDPWKCRDLFGICDQDGYVSGRRVSDCIGGGPADLPLCGISDPDLQCFTCHPKRDMADQRAGPDGAQKSILLQPVLF